MSVNKYQEHLLVLPEDDAIRQLANGFLLDPSVQTRRIQVLNPAGGWKNVRDAFAAEHAGEMGKYPGRYLVLLIDCDDEVDRLQQERSRIPSEYADRVFILGIASESEDLKRAFASSFENIGKNLALDCRHNTDEFWGHALLKENALEIRRLRECVHAFLFDK